MRYPLALIYVMVLMTFLIKGIQQMNTFQWVAHMRVVQIIVISIFLPLALYANDGSAGAAIGAGLGAGIYANEKEAFASMKQLQYIGPSSGSTHEELYAEWKELLQQRIGQV